MIMVGCRPEQAGARLNGPGSRFFRREGRCSGLLKLRSGLFLEARRTGRDRKLTRAEGEEEQDGWMEMEASGEKLGGGSISSDPNERSTKPSAYRQITWRSWRCPFVPPASLPIRASGSGVSREENVEANYVITIADKKSAASRSLDFVMFLHKRLVMIT